MNEEIIKEIARDFANSGRDRYENSFVIGEDSKFSYRIHIEKESRTIYDSIGAENYISALPSGNICPRCNGTGKV